MSYIRKPRVLMLLSIVLLSGVFLFPLWQLTLEAPQFPEGLKLNIWINRFSGDGETGQIIQNINILNHYIGMQYIEPDSIPEFTYFPYIIYGMMGLGIVALLINRAWTYAGWMLFITLLAALGMYDFYLWLYDYGHNLDPNAPIKVPGMVYMPPLFGKKDLLNFSVTSYPHYGTGFIVFSIIGSLLASWKRKNE